MIYVLGIVRCRCEYRVVPTMIRGIGTYFVTFFAKVKEQAAIVV